MACQNKKYNYYSFAQNGAGKGIASYYYHDLILKRSEDDDKHVSKNS